MARATRSSKKSSQDQSSPKAAAGTKRKASVSASPAGKNTKKAQKTLEQTLPGGEEDEGAAHEEKPPQVAETKTKDTEMTEDIRDADMKDAVDGDDAEATKEDTNGDAKAEKIDVDTSAEIQAKDQQEADADGQKNDAPQAADPATQDKVTEEPKKEPEEKQERKQESEAEKPAEPATNGDGAVESSQGRGEAMPSNILEKGIIYFITRARVGTDEPSSVQDIARSYIVLRPLPHNAKLTDGPIDEMKNARLLALPKKVLPRSHRDVFMTYVEKAGATMSELKDDFFAGSTYSTQTAGVRTQPPVSPIGEGVYAITTANRSTHLAYMLTIPKEMGSVQEDMGLAAQGSFALSLKNPTSKGPANTNLGTDPGFSNEIMEEFRGRSWMPPEPKHLEYSSAQFLLIGEAHGELKTAVQPEEKDEKDEKTETPHEELDKLEEEDGSRVEALRGDDSVFDDLGISSKDYSLLTTW